MVFFKSRCTVLKDKESTICSSTLFSAISRNVHLAQPPGTSLHANAMIRASVSPVILGSTGGVVRFFLCKNAVIFSAAKKAVFTLVTVAKLTLSCSAISTNFIALPFSDVSNKRIIFARMIDFALCTPVLVNISNSFRCSAVNWISFFSSHITSIPYDAISRIFLQLLDDTGY